jgi:hypothetical protein
MNRIHSACRFLTGLARRAGVLVSPAGALVSACFVKWRC